MRLFAVLLAFGTLLLYVLGPMSLESALASRRLELLALERQARRGGLATGTQFKDGKEKFLKRLAGAGKEVEVMIAASRTLADSGLEIESIRYSSEPLAQSGLSRFTFIVPARGSFTSFLDCMEKLAALPGLTYLDRLRITRANVKQFNFELELVTVIR